MTKQYFLAVGDQLKIPTWDRQIRHLDPVLRGLIAD